jgi:tetratricopeptide (TPR) repeat protein
MATYQKRGYKPKSKKEKEEKLHEDSTTAEVFDTLDEKASKTEEFVRKNQNIIFGLIGVIVIGALGYLGYQNFILEPKEKEAAIEMNQAQIFFDNAINATGKAQDSIFNLAINGGNSKLGFVDVASNYSGTKTASLAHYYAGISYLNIGEYEKAIEHLDQFKLKDEVIAPMAKGAIGDAFLQINQPEDALGYYQDAIKLSNNSFTTPKYLLKAAITALDIKQPKKAMEFLERIKQEFPDATENKRAKALMGQAQAAL